MAQDRFRNIQGETPQIDGPSFQDENSPRESKKSESSSKKMTRLLSDKLDSIDRKSITPPPQIMDILSKITTPDK